MEMFEALTLWLSFMGGICMHEIVHAYVAMLLGCKNVRANFRALEVTYESNSDIKTRIASLSPPILGITGLVGYLLISAAPNLHAVLFFVGMVLLTSYSDLSVRAAKSIPTKWTSLDSSIKIVVGGVLLFAASKVLEIITMRNLPLIQLDRTLFAFFTILADVAFISGIGVIVIAGALHLLGDGVPNVIDRFRK